MAKRERSDTAQLLAWIPQAALLALARALPYRARLAFAGWLLRVAVAVVPDLRLRARANLARVFPDKPLAERRRIARDMADHLGRTAIETMTGDAFRTRADWSEPRGAGWPVFERARAEGRGVLLVSGHFGQWEACRGALKARGIECGALYRPLKNRRLERRYRQSLEDFGKPIVNRDRPGLRELVRHLRVGGVIAVLMDQYVNRGLPLDFLGHPAPSGTMIAELARKLDVPMIPVYCTRAPDRLHVAIEFEAPIPPGDPAAMTQAANHSLAARVRANPEQYLWLHRRWTKSLGR